ncbi:MAG: ABC transporter permease [Candidatus Heimdallarchaeota archaeon]|nr:ABC transporter permease [Candidatus Heimdallarchaeota archaeon]
MNKKKGQFKAILKKDLKLVFTWKTILLTIGVPFIMMFAIVFIPTIIAGSGTTIVVCTDDATQIIPHTNGTLYSVNLGNNSIFEIQKFASQNTNIDIIIVDTRSEALNTSNGIYFPSNFTSSTFNGQSFFEYRKTASDLSIQGYNFDSVINIIQQVVFSTFLFLNNITENNIPQVDLAEYIPPVIDTDKIWSQETLGFAMPFAYALFILLSLIGNMGRTIGFSKEKEDGTFETMLSITKNRSNLVYSKLIVGIIASILTLLSYFTGAAIAGGISFAILGGTSSGTGVEGFLSVSLEDLLSFKGVVLLVGIGLALIITMLALMAVDTMFPKNIAERVGVPVVMAFGLIFMISVFTNPGESTIIAQISPYYWIYHFCMSIIDLSFGWVDAIYLTLSIGLFFAMTFIARKAIEREKVLFF